MNLCVHEASVFFQPLEGVTGVAVLLVVAIWGSAIREQNHDLMDGLGVIGKIVLEHVRFIHPAVLQTHPEHISILQVALWMSLLSVNEVGELGWIANEEYWGIVKDPVPVSFLSPEFDRKATRIARGIGRSVLSSDGREADCAAHAVAHFVEERLGGDVAQIVGHLEVTMGTSALSMNLGSVGGDLERTSAEMLTTRSGIRSRSKCASRSMWWKSIQHYLVQRIRCPQISFLLTLEQEGPVDSSSLGRKGMRNGCTVGSSVDTGGH